MKNKKLFVLGMPPSVYSDARAKGAKLDENRRCYFVGEIPPEFERYRMPESIATPASAARVVINALAVVAQRPAEHDPELTAILDGIADPEHRSAVIADYYRGKIAKILGRHGSLTSTLEGKEWARRLVAKADRGEVGQDEYRVKLAREALR